MKVNGLLFAFVNGQVFLDKIDTNDVLRDNVWYGRPSKIVRGQIGIPGDDEKRYNDLKDMAVKYWRKNGMLGADKFDERKYWAYGCHCFLLGDRPLSEMGRGRPKDALDNKCKAYKDCQKCVRKDFGDACIGEFVRYKWQWNNRAADLISSDQPGTCERQLFECDKQLIKDTMKHHSIWNQDYHAFWSEVGFDNRDPANCPKNGGTPVEHECCGGNGKVEFWMNTNTHECVDDVPVPLY